MRNERESGSEASYSFRSTEYLLNIDKVFGIELYLRNEEED